MLTFSKGDAMPEGATGYKKKTVVQLLKIMEPFVCDSREGNSLEGQAGDFLASDGHGGFYPISAEFHAANYEECSDE